MRGPRTLVGRLFVWQVGVVLAVLAGLGVAVDRALERDLVDGLTDSLAQQARTVQASLPSEPTELQPAVRALGAAGDVRITVIAADGTVLAESDRADVAGIEDHGDRPEVIEAQAGAVGIDVRRSETVGRELLYVALPPQEGRIVRLAIDLGEVRARQARVRAILIVGLLAAAGAAVTGVLLVSRRITRPLARMRGSLDRLSEGDLDVRVEASGTAELTALGETLNRMTERLAAQIRSTREEQRTRDVVLTSMEEGVLLLDPDGRIAFANPAIEEHLGGRPEDAGSLFPTILRDAVREAAHARDPVTVEVQLDRPARTLRGSAVPVGEGSVLLVLRDVTETLRVDRIRRDFVTNASHELKTPAAAIRATAEALRLASADDPAAVPRFAAQLEREAVRLAQVVADLLDLSRLESGSDLAQTVDLGALVAEEVGRFHDRAEELSLSIEVEADGPLSVKGSAGDLALLIRNLLDNAIRYTRPGGRVEVRLAADGGDAVLRVSDTGIGIPSRDLERVFERFYRVDRARSRETGGTGLGLALVRHVAENHGGTVDATSELGVGSEFEVRLPLAR